MTTEPANGKTAEVLQRLEELIQALNPGSPLPPVHLLKAEFKVGYQTLNQALQLLATQQRIEIIRNKGIFVKNAREAVPVASDSDGWKSRLPMAGSPRPRLQLYALNCDKIIGGIAHKLVAAYNAADPVQKVELVTVKPEQLPAFNQEADFDLLLSMTHIDRSLAVRDHALLNLSELIPETMNADAFFPFVWRSDAAGRRIGAMPWATSSNQLCCHPEVLAKHPLPPEALHNPVVFADYLKTLPAAGKNSSYRFLFYGYMSWFERLNIPWTRPGSNDIELTPEALAPLLQWLTRLSAEKHLAPWCSDTYRIYDKASMPALLEALRGATFFEVPVSMELDPATCALLPLPTVPGGREPLFGAEFNIGANAFYAQESWKFIEFALSEAGQSLCCDPRHHWPIPVRRSTMAALFPGEAGALSARQLERTRLVYNEHPDLFPARFMIELAIESWLKKPTTVEALCDHLNRHLQRFLRRRS